MNWMSSTPSRISCTSRSPLAWPAGRSTWVMSPVTTTREPKPSLVRNIFICSAEVFCASSRMMKESFSVRPRRTLDRARRDERREGLGTQHGGQCVVQGAQVRVDLLVRGAGQEAEALTRLHRGPGEDDPVDLLGLQRLDRLGHRQVGLSG